MLNVEVKNLEDEEIELAIVSAATLRVVRRDRPTPRRSSFSGAGLYARLCVPGSSPTLSPLLSLRSCVLLPS